VTRRHHTLIATFVVSAIGLPALAAPPETTSRKKRPGRYKLGPIYLTPKLELKNAGVDTNLFNARAGAIADNSMVLSPGLSGALPIGQRLRLTGSGHLDFNYFRHVSSERSTDFAGEGRAEVDVGPFTLFGGAGGGQFRQRFSIDLDERLLRQEKWAATGFTYRMTNKFSTTLEGTGRIYSFEPSQDSGRSVQRALDRNELTGTAQLRFALTSQTTLLLSVDAIEDRFLKQTIEPRTTRSYRYLGGFEFGERALVNGKVLAGFREFPSGQGSPAYRGPAIAVSVSTPLLRLGRLTGFAERDVFYSVSSAVVVNEVLRNSFASTSFRFEASVELPFDLIGRGSFGLQEAKYILPFQFRNTAFQRVDHLWTTGGSILRRFGDSVRIGGTLSWSRRVSNAPGFSYEGFRYGVQAEVVP